MREWNLRLERLKSLALAADTRFCQTDYTNDHIWELEQSSGDPPGLNLRTTFGLRARSYRLFPRFRENDRAISDPKAFDGAPILHRIYPNFALLTVSPFPGIDVTTEYWVPESHAVTGRVTITNSGVTPRNLRVDWIALLSPGSDGHRMVATEMQGGWVLSGASGGLEPVLFFTGGATVLQGPYPALSFEISLLPGNQHQATWVQASLTHETDSLELARRVAARAWDAERGRIEIVNAGQIEIHTGNEEWDILFALGKQMAYRLFVGPGSGLPHAAPVVSRQADQGYSMRGDGSDYSHLWSGISPLQAWYLSGILLPEALEQFKGILLNFLSKQDDETGEIDWKPGIGGQASGMQATPILANLTWKIYEINDDRDFLSEVFPALTRYIQAWFRMPFDRDGDGVPEWAHPAQFGLDDHPFFTRLGVKSLGQDISTFETPSLCAFLYQECRALIQIAESIDRLEPIPALAAFAENIRSAVEANWDEAASTYQYWDRDTHLTTKGIWLGQHEGSGSVPVRRELPQPTRLVLRIDAPGELPSRPQVTIFGNDGSGETVQADLPSDEWDWFLGFGSLTTKETYTKVESLKIQGINLDDQLTLTTTDHQIQDLTLLAPLWAGIPAKSRARAIIDNMISTSHKYWKPFGLAPMPEDSLNITWIDLYLPWQAIIGEGMNRYGYRAKVAELTSHIMAGMAFAFKQSGCFFDRYSATTGSGIGEENKLDGLPPIGLFLQTLGVRIYSPWKVALQGHNPYAWPVTLRYRGLTIDRHSDKTILSFPDGQSITIEDPAPCTVFLESTKTASAPKKVKRRLPVIRRKTRV